MVTMLRAGTSAPLRVGAQAENVLHGYCRGMRALVQAVLVLILGSCSLPLLCSGSSVAPTACYLTIGQFRVAPPRNLWPRDSYYHACPAGCLAAIDRTQPERGAQLWGSFPYHSNSSACLAFIHAGVVNATLGGAAYMYPFLRHEWTGDERQTVFPYNSSLGSYSNGVQSLAVPSTWHHTPADADEYSFSVATRTGLCLMQKRQAPFSPRAGHAHPPQADFGSAVVELIVGGHNATHYMNDVWAAVSVISGLEMLDWTWQQLPDAPFTPRAEMQTHVLPQGNVYQIFFVGGTTGYRCGLREFGECVNEVWRAVLTYAGQTPKLTWDVAVARAPWPARCAATLFGVDPFSRFGAFVGSGWLAGITGGSLSYSDPSCRAPLQHLNDVWYSIGALQDAASWYRGPDAPFSPRRSMQHDPYFLHGGDNYFLKATLVGGLRIVSHRANESSGLAVLTRVRMYAEVWQCVMPARGQLLFNVSACDWGLPNVPADSTPLPTAGLPHMWLAGGAGGFLFGGQSSAAGIEAFRNTLPDLRYERDKVNVSEIRVNLSVIISPRLGEPAQNLEELMWARQQLPLSQELDEAELNGQSAYRLGSDWVVARYTFDSPGNYYAAWYNFPAASTAHYQPMAFIETPEQSDLYSVQEASSLNTTRGLFNFPLRRLGHGTTLRSYQSQWVYQSVSGGRSGEEYNNDWIRLCDPACMQSTEVQYRHSLGPVKPLPHEWDRPDSMKPPADRTAYCAPGFHWEPPSSSLAVTLYCAPNGMWMNHDLKTVQSCQPDQLNCTFPLVDLGFEVCEEPRPVVRGIAIGGAFNADDMTVLSATFGGQVLTIYGSFFSMPLRVLVGGRECIDVELWATVNASSALVCENSTNSNRVCEMYASEIRCITPSMYGLNLPVTVQSGFSGFLADVLSNKSVVAAISSSPPRITGLNSTQCTRTGAVQLIDCAVSHPFNVTVTVGADTRAPEYPLAAYLAASQPLKCADWTGGAESGSDSYVAECLVTPRLGQLLPVIVLQSGLPLFALGDASLSFRTCEAGSTANITVLAAGSWPVCVPCPPGYFSASDESACEPCRPGTFANMSGLAACSLCDAGYQMPDSNATACLLCPLNSVAPGAGRVACSSCSLDTYIVYSTAVAGQSASRASGNCTACPSGGSCQPDGPILAQSGSFLLIDQAAGTVSSVACSSACISAVGCLDAELPPEVVRRSELPVWNCCADGRKPAYSLAGEVNVLCAECLPGHSLVSGRCIPCASVQWASLLGKLLLAFVLVYALHRLPHDWSGSATLTIGGYFVQLSLLFLASEALPPVLSLFNLSVAGDHQTRGATGQGTSGFYAGSCTLPMSDYGRIGQALLSPFIACGLLGLILLMQLVCRAAMRSSSRSAPIEQLPQLQRALLDPAQAPQRDHSSTWAHKAYYLLFRPSSVAVTADDQDEDANGSGRGPVIAASAELLDQRQSEADTSQHILLWYQRTAVRLLLLTFTPFSLIALSYFSTQQVGRFGSRVIEYPTIDPESEEYRSLVVVMAAVIALLVAGLPLALLVWMYRQHRAGAIARLRDEQAMQPRRDAGAVLPARVALLLQLCIMYRAELWWFPAFSLIRRLLLVAVLVFVRDASVWIWLTLVNTLLLALQLWLRPYSRAQDNAAEALTLLSLLLQTTLLCRWPPPYMDAGLLALLMAIVTGPLLFMAGQVGAQRWRQHRSLPRLSATVAAALDKQSDNSGL